MEDLEQKIKTPAFQAALNASEHLGPFSKNPKIDKMYRTLRLLGFNVKDASNLINTEIERRATISNTPIIN